MFIIQSSSVMDNDKDVMICAQLQIKKANEEKVKEILKKLTEMPVGEEWVLSHAGPKK